MTAGLNKPVLAAHHSSIDISDIIHYEVLNTRTIYISTIRSRSLTAAGRVPEGPRSRILRSLSVDLSSRYETTISSLL